MPSRVRTDQGEGKCWRLARNGTKTRSTRANHLYKLYVKPARLNCYKHSFFVRTVKLWNELPGDIVEADSFKHFKSKLKMYLNI